MTNNEQIPPPAQIKWAAILAGVQCVFGLAFALLLIVRQLTGQRDAAIVYESENANTSVALGTGLFFIVIFGTVLIAAIFMVRAKRWGRGPVVMLEMMLGLISIYVFSAGQIIPGIVLLASALLALAMLFSPRAVEWTAAQYNA